LERSQSPEWSEGKAMKRSDVIRTIADHGNELREQFAVKSLALFGSVARDEASDRSDVDLLVEFDRPVGLLHLIGTEQQLADWLGVKKVDLVLRRAVIEELKENVFREAINVFDTPDVETPPSAHEASGS
jgi:hypothetical protein